VAFLKTRADTPFGQAKVKSPSFSLENQCATDILRKNTGEQMQKRSNQWLGHWILVLWAIANIWTHWNSWSWDASALYFAAYFYDLGQFALVYSPEPAFFWGDTPPPEWVALAASQSTTVGDMSPYVYPPLWAAILAPVASKISALLFFNLFYVVNTGAIVGSVYLAYGFIRPQKLAFPIWCIATIVMLQFTIIGQLALDLNQPQIIVTFLIIAAFRALLAGRDTGAGALLALAAAIKIAPALLAIIFIMERRWRALGVFAAVGLALLGLSLLLAGVDLHRVLLVRLQDLYSQVLISRITVTLDAVLVQLSNWVSGHQNWAFIVYELQSKPVWVGLITKAALLIGLMLTYFFTRKLPPDLRLWYRLQLVFLVTLITGPLAWIHYLILTLLLLPGFVGLAQPRVAWGLLGAFTAVFSAMLYLELLTQGWVGNAQLFANFMMVLGTIGLFVATAMRRSD